MALPRQAQIGVGTGSDGLGAGGNLGRDRLEGGGLQRLAGRVGGNPVGHEIETLDAPDIFAFDQDGAIFLDV